MNTIKGNLLDRDCGILVHQVNCVGAMGAGVAAQIREKWPIVFRQYRKAYAEGMLIPGSVQFVEVGADLWVANFAGQLDCGLKATIYSAYDEGLPKIVARAAELRLPIYFPKLIGCGLAGGDWPTVLALLEKYCPDATLVEFQPKEVVAA